MITPQITIRRKADKVEFLSRSGARVAYIEDLMDEITYDPYADTEAVMTGFSYEVFFREHGITVSNARAIADMSEPR